MAKWKRVKEGAKVIEYQEDEKVIAQYLGAKGELSASFVDEYDKLYAKDCPHKVKIIAYKIIAYICILFFTFGTAYAQNLSSDHAFYFNLGLIIIGVLAFVWVRYIKFPNEQFSYFHGIILMLITMFIIIMAYSNKNEIFDNVQLLANPGDDSLMTSEQYDLAEKRMKVFFIITCVLTIASQLFGFILSKKRFLLIMTPLISMGGFSLAILIMNTALGFELVNASNYKKYMFLALLALVIFNVIVMIIVRFLGGPRERER